MTSHREAPSISKDPVADNTDLYAFVSPDDPSTVTLIANYIPLEEPAGGPNFFQFGDDVHYKIHIDNDGDALAEIEYEFIFTTQIRNTGTFLYNTGPITSLDDPNWNNRQFYDVIRWENAQGTRLGTTLASPPVNIGPRSTPNYPDLANAAIHTLKDGSKVFAGQRAEQFYVDLGSIFDLLTLRPLENFHLIPTPPAPGRDATKGFNVHTIALQIPKRLLTANGSNPTDPMSSGSVIGVWASSMRQQVSVLQGSQNEPPVRSGPFTQVSRLANPLINEVFIPLLQKDYWNTQPPANDSQFAQRYVDPEVAHLMRLLYPKVLPNVPIPPADPRSDLVAILLTGIPSGLIPGFQNFTGATQADMLRLNMAIPPTASPNRLGLIAGDPQGFPNGRRPLDDVVDIYLQVAAGVVYPLVNPSFTPDAAAKLLTDGVDAPDVPFLTSFPYLQHPYQGFEHYHDPTPPVNNNVNPISTL